MATLIVGIMITLGSLLLLASPWPYLAPLLFAGIFGVALLYRHPAWGLVGLAVLIPFEGAFKNTGFTGAKLLGGSVLAILALRLLLGQTPAYRLRSRMWIPVYFFILAALISLMYSEHTLASIGNLRELLIGMTFFVMTMLVCRDLDLRKLYALIGISVAATAFFALLSTRYQIGGRAIGLLQDANYFALLIALAFPAAVLMLLHARHWFYRLFWLATLGLLFIGMVKTDSRSGLLVVLICLAIAGWHHRDKIGRLQPRHFGFLILGGALLVPLAAKSLPADYVNRIKTLSFLKSGVNPYQDASLGRRASYLVVGKEMIRENPLVGSGPGTFPLHYAKSAYAKAFSENMGTHDLFRRAHNTYLEVFSEMGVPAGLSFIAIILAGLYNFHDARRRFLAGDDRDNADLAAHLGLGFLAIALFLMFLSIPNHKYLWMFLALSVVIQQQARTQSAVAGPEEVQA